MPNLKYDDLSELYKGIPIAYYLKWSEVTQSCLTLCDPMDSGLPGSAIHGIFQVRILEWVAISSTRESSRTKDWTHVSCMGRQILYHWATREALDTS